MSQRRTGDQRSVRCGKQGGLCLVELCEGFLVSVYRDKADESF